MIVGVGSDLCDIRRIEASLARFGDRFIQRVFTKVEQHKAAASGDPAKAYAKRYAAKEACAKALGTGIFREGVNFTDIGVVNDPSGRPSLVLTGGAAARLAKMTPAGGGAALHLTLTDEPPYAQAFVVIEAWP